MIARPLALPDETDRSYLGAFMRINGLQSNAEALNLIARWTRSTEPDQVAGSSIDLLRRVAGIDLQSFVRQHTTLPLRRGVAGPRALSEHGSIENHSLHRCSGMRQTRAGAFFCPDCVAADQDFHGRSYWRREHQTPGLYWCPKHRIPLRYMSDRRSFLLSPSVCFERAAQIEERWSILVAANPFVAKYLGICAGMMDNARPLPVRQVRFALVAAAKEQSLRTFPTKAPLKPSEHLLSDVMLEAYPRDWIVGLIPSLGAKLRGRDLRQVDGVFWHTVVAAPAITYALAAAVLFETADSALQALAQHQPPPVMRPVRKLPVDEMESARRAYLVSGGSYSCVLSSLGSDGPRAILELEAGGLPDMDMEGSREALCASVAFFLDGRPLEECLQLAGGARVAFESMIRISGNRFKAALCEIVVSVASRPHCPAA